MIPKRLSPWTLLLLLFLCSHCKKDHLPPGLSGPCKDCSDRYKKAKKIRKITSLTTSGTTTVFDFAYDDHAISTIALTRNGAAAGTYQLYYTEANCIPSGFHFDRSDAFGVWDLYGSYLISGGRVIRRTLTHNYRNPYTNDTANSSKYDYNADGRISKDEPGFGDAPLYDNVIHISYSASGNLQQIQRFGGSAETITLDELDTKNNPFRQQEGMFYIMKFLPFTSVNRSVDDVFHFFSLNVNNPLRFQYIDSGISEFEFTMEYVYGPDGYPTKVDLYRAPYTGRGTPGPRLLQETLTLAY